MMDLDELLLNARITGNSAILAQLSTLPAGDLDALNRALTQLAPSVFDGVSALPAGVRRLPGEEDLLEVRVNADLRALVKPDLARRTIEVLAAAREAQIKSFSQALKKSA